MPLKEAVATFEREYLILHLYWNRGNVQKTALALKITRLQTIRLIRKHHLNLTVTLIRSGLFTLPKTWVTFVRPTPTDDTRQ